MKPSLPLRFKLLAFCAVLLVLQSCVAVPGSRKNEEISEGKREDFHRLNTEALQYLKAGDIKGLKTLLSKKFTDTGNRVATLIGKRLKDDPYELLDEYYVVNKYRDSDTVAVKTGDIKRYALVYPYVAAQMYLAFFVPKTGPANKYLVSLIYGKFDSGWKIAQMEVGSYTVNGKTAPELFALAKDELDKKYYQAALTNVTFALSCIKPSSTWQYPEEDDASIFYDKLNGSISFPYNFPIVLKQVASGPMLLGVTTKNTPGGSYPFIYYMTHFNVKDTAAVKKENLQMQTVVDKLMPGLGEGSEYIMYSALNKMPAGPITGNHFDMMEKVH
jgi:hypothetical protein